MTEAEVAGLTERCTEAMGGCGVVALCGTQPPGAEGLYERLALSLAHTEPARPLTPGERASPMLLLDGFKVSRKPQVSKSVSRRVVSSARSWSPPSSSLLRSSVAQ